MRDMQQAVMEKLLAVIRARGDTQADVARTAFKVPKENFGNWKRRGLPAEYNPAAARYIGCSIDELMHVPLAEILRREKAGLYTARGSKHSMVVSDQRLAVPGGRVPVVGTAQLGDGGYWTELEHPVGSGDGYLDIPSRDQNAYAVRVVGDSMLPRIRSGDFVLCEPNYQYRPGDDVLVVTSDGRSMVKEFLYERDGFTVLLSLNGNHGRLSIATKDIEKIHYVAGVLRSARWVQE